MKLIKGTYLLMMLLASFRVCFGQEKLEPLLVDTFGGLNCEDIMARTDSFLSELLNNPNLKGYVIIHPEKNSLKHGLRIEKIIKSNVYLRRFDKSRISIVQSNETDVATVELWKVPVKAEKLSFIEEKWAESDIAITKPFIFGSHWDDDSCPTFIPENYANLIKDNLNLRGHIVIFNKSKKEAQSKMEEWLKLFTQEYKVPLNKLKIFYGTNNGIPDVEFWVVPQK